MQRLLCSVTLCAQIIGAIACAGSDTAPRPDSWWPPRGDGQVTPQPDLYPTPGREAGPPSSDSEVSRDTVGPQDPDQGQEFNCGPADSECGSSDYMKSCTGGTCFARECCCPEARKCRVGSFPKCCEPGTVCTNASTGECS